MFSQLLVQGCGERDLLISQQRAHPPATWMVYFASWEQFQEAVENLYARSTFDVCLILIHRLN
jgi:hypothetical protein